MSFLHVIVLGIGDFVLLVVFNDGSQSLRNVAEVGMADGCNGAIVLLHFSLLLSLSLLLLLLLGSLLLLNHHFSDVFLVMIKVVVIVLVLVIVAVVVILIFLVHGWFDPALLLLPVEQTIKHQI
jgi:hypothetical protein